MRSVFYAQLGQTSVFFICILSKSSMVCTSHMMPYHKYVWTITTNPKNSYKFNIAVINNS